MTRNASQASRTPKSGARRPCQPCPGATRKEESPERDFPLINHVFKMPEPFP